MGNVVRLTGIQLRSIVMEEAGKAKKRSAKRPHNKPARMSADEALRELAQAVADANATEHGDHDEDIVLAALEALKQAGVPIPKARFQWDDAPEGWGEAELDAFERDRLPTRR